MIVIVFVCFFTALIAWFVYHPAIVHFLGLMVKPLVRKHEELAKRYGTEHRSRVTKPPPLRPTGWQPPSESAGVEPRNPPAGGSNVRAPR